MSIIMNGKELSAEIRSELKKEVNRLKEYNIIPKLAVIMVGDDKASQIYVRNKSRACDDIGIQYEEYLLPSTIEEKELYSIIDKLNKRKDVNGILLQSPIPKHLNIDKAFQRISPEKDVDGFNPINVGKLSLGQDTFVSCTPYGIIKILEKYNINLEGTNAVIVGRSNIVGKPLAQCFLAKHATVTICHSRTKNIEEITQKADIVVVALGKSKFLKENMVKDGAIVIDVGINRDEQGKISGDADYENLKDKVSYITPVPGGVGPMTITMLMNNVIKATKEQYNQNSTF